MHKRNIGLTIAMAIVLAASSHLALGSERTKTYGLPSYSAPGWEENNVFNLSRWPMRYKNRVWGPNGFESS